MKLSPISCVCFALAIAFSCSAMATEPMPQNAKPVRLTPFVLGQARSFAPRHIAPKTVKEAIARKTTAARGLTVIELPEDRMVNLVQVRRADSTPELQHEPGQPTEVTE